MNAPLDLPVVEEEGLTLGPVPGAPDRVRFAGTGEAEGAAVLDRFLGVLHQQVLAREPRHFGALAGLGMIMQEVGDDKRALEAFRKALAINPHLEKVPAMVKSLTEKVEGRDI